jgi:prolipoprotein diacylglyceryltransferase/membrane-associated phospholipid phosphatase/protein-S-isoprenylcysteine O-methyltransferase Ste14
MALVTERLGKVLYAFLFAVALPLFLIAWAYFSEANVPLPVVAGTEAGWIVCLIGLALIVSGVWALKVYGDGLPMNPYPPKKYVSKGIFRYLAHPIYVGFSILCVGASIVAHSPGGLWLVSPVVVLGCLALVEGYERQDLETRFGRSIQKPLLSLPASDDRPPRFWDRLSVYVLVLGPWLILYEMVPSLGLPADRFTVYLPFETRLPVIQWTEALYASTYVIVCLAPLFARTRMQLREFSIAGLIATGVITVLFLAIPIVAIPRPFESTSALGELLLFERASDTPAAAFPSFHVVWALLAARVYARCFPRLKALWWGWAVLVSASCVTTGMHAILDVLAGFVVYFFATNVQGVWEFIRSRAERFSNSWREWHIGPVRVINHGIYAGIGTFIGITLVGALIGSDSVLPTLIVAVSGLVISALWAQFIEGSPRLLRPYGYYGGVVGVIIGSLIAHALGTSLWLLLAAFCVAGPWIQSFGRLRCLIQGCCHGRVASEAIGIRYTHPRSRVCRLSELGGVPIHPTPVYSILWNVLIAFVMTRLWFIQADFSVIVGLYLILTGLGRFVEEAYRGEPQTPIIRGLRLYQWIAILTIVLGTVSTTLGSTGQSGRPQFAWESVIAGLAFGLFTWFALGVDFPNSNRRFARLA